MRRLIMFVPMLLLAAVFGRKRMVPAFEAATGPCRGKPAGIDDRRGRCLGEEGASASR